MRLRVSHLVAPHPKLTSMKGKCNPTNPIFWDAMMATLWNSKRNRKEKPSSDPHKWESNQKPPMHLLAYSNNVNMLFLCRKVLNIQGFKIKYIQKANVSVLLRRVGSVPMEYCFFESVKTKILTSVNMKRNLVHFSSKRVLNTGI